MTEHPDVVEPVPEEHPLPGKEPADIPDVIDPVRPGDPDVVEKTL